MRSLMTLTVNGERREVAVPVHHTLLEVLREDLALPGTKHGCELGECGTCTVLVDGQPILSCLALAVECQDAAILTVEGLADGRRLRSAPAGLRGAGGGPVRILHARDPADRPGPARPDAAARPRRDPGRARREPVPLHGVHEDPRRRRARRRPDGGARRPERPMSAPERPLSVIGQRLPKVDAWAKVTGETRFADDLVLPRMAYAKLLRAQHPHALIRRIDTTRAAALPGVYAVITGRDFPPIRFGIMPVSQDEEPLCVDKVRFVGDPVAAVAAVDEETAEAAARMIDVEYEPLDSLMSIEAALREGTHRIHEYGDGHNIHKQVSLEFGDVEEGFREADLVREDVFFFEGNTHLPMEQHAAVAAVDAGREAHALVLDPDAALRPPRARQGPRDADEPHPRHRDARTAAGSAGKSDPFSHEMVVARLAQMTGRPVKMTLTREEVFYMPPGPASGADVGAVGRAEGRRDHGPALPDLARRRRVRLLRRRVDLLHGRAPDGDLPDRALQVRGRAASSRTSRPAARSAATARPSPGSPSRCHLDKIAEELGLDPAEMRRRTVVPEHRRR